MAKETVDFDQQYKEDLERAQALSLESLALEQFKNKHLQELYQNPSSDGTRARNVSGKWSRVVVSPVLID